MALRTIAQCATGWTPNDADVQFSSAGSSSNTVKVNGIAIKASR